MGEAKRRGTAEERAEVARERERLDWAMEMTLDARALIHAAAFHVMHDANKSDPATLTTEERQTIHALASLAAQRCCGVGPFDEDDGLGRIDDEEDDGDADLLDGEEPARPRTLGDAVRAAKPVPGFSLVDRKPPIDPTAP